MESDEAVLSRRDLLGLCAVTGIGVAAVAVPILRYLGPSALSAAGAEVEVPIDRLRLWEAERILVRGVPAYVVRTPDALLACSAVCTHLGCVTRWNRSRRIYFCPCHGARFAPDGRVLSGPAPSPLPRYDIVVRQGKARFVEPA